METNKSAGNSGPYRLVVFNHKGGVGKTTLTVNIASRLARKGKRVLLVDTDPQCNLTSYLIDAQVVDDLLDNSETDKGGTLWTAVKPMVEGDGDIREIEPIELSHRNLYLLPGDIRLSEYEAELSEFWGQCLQRKTRGFRGTTAISRLVTSIATKHKIDFVFYDVGPNIGALNRVILLDATHFIVAVAADVFSLRALRTLGRTLASWIQDWKTITALAPSGTYLLKGKPKFLGYIPQRFRVYAARPAAAQAGILGLIGRHIRTDIVAVLARLDPALVPNTKVIKLGEVKDFGAVVSKAQIQGVPISSVQGGSESQKDAAFDAFSAIADRILEAVSEPAAA